MPWGLTCPGSIGPLRPGQPSDRHRVTLGNSPGPVTVCGRYRADIFRNLPDNRGPQDHTRDSRWPRHLSGHCGRPFRPAIPAGHSSDLSALTGHAWWIDTPHVALLLARHRSRGPVLSLREHTSRCKVAPRSSPRWRASWSATRTAVATAGTWCPSSAPVRPPTITPHGCDPGAPCRTREMHLDANGGANLSCAHCGLLRSAACPSQ